ncbi:MAG: DUF1320 family protein [Victivallales bacterium]|jgi:phage gp36-like protein|nr:DUF1320 family protein [Victivallales bacterium]
MSYLTTADVQLRLRNTYDDVYYSADEEAVDTDLVDQDIASAEGIVDGYVAIRYITPVTDATALRLVQAWALTLVEELAYTARATGELPAGLEKRIERVYAALERVASGELTLGATPAPAENTDVADSLIIDGDDPMMTKDGMAGL